MGGGGGGDNGYEARQADTEARKAEARRQLNYQFGEGNGSPTTAPVVLTGRLASSFQPVLNLLQPPQSATAENPNRAARQQLYAGVRENTFTAGKRGLDEAREQAGRRNKFELFANGLNGGSEDIDQNALMDRTYNQGILDLGAKADAAQAGFRANDEATRLGLLQSIDNGMDQSSAMSSAIAQMQNNSDRATAEAQGTNLGDLFENAGLLYTRSRQSQGKKDADAWWNINSGDGKASIAGKTGTVSKTY